MALEVLTFFIPFLVLQGGSLLSGGKCKCERVGMSACEESTSGLQVRFVASEEEGLLGCGLSPFRYLGHHGPCVWTRAREDGGLWRVLGALFEVLESWSLREPQTGQTPKPSMEPVRGMGILVHAARGARGSVRMPSAGPYESSVWRLCKVLRAELCGWCLEAEFLSRWAE